MTNFSRNKKDALTIRKKITIMIIFLFLVMFSVLYFVFYNTMQTMINSREDDNIKNQVQLAEKILLSSYEYLPKVNRDWANWDYTYEFVNGNFNEFLEYYLNDHLYELYNLEFITLLDVEGKIIYERFYDWDDTPTQNPITDLTAVYTKLGPLCASTYVSDSITDEAEPLGMDGFLKVDDQLAYISAFPIIRSDNTGPCVGSMLFGRIIYNHEIDFIDSPDITFSIHNRDLHLFNNEQTSFAQEEKTLVAVDGKNSLSAYKLFANIYGEKNLMLTVIGPRTLHKQSTIFIYTTLLIIALCCTVILFVILKFLGSIIVKPFARLVSDVNQINFESVDPLPLVKHENSEFNKLMRAINNLLHRIMTDKKVIEDKNEKLHFNANFDILTGLKNWSNCRESLAQLIANSQSDFSIGVFLIDLDRFKFINDTLGHSVGDKFIVAISQRLQQMTSNQAIVGRISGDKFVIIESDFNELHEIKIFANKIMALFQTSFAVKNREMNISATVGYSIFPFDGKDADTLIKNAEIAMYRGKELGRNSHCRYESEFNEVLQRKLYVENKIRNAISDDCRQFRLHFQPKALSKTGEIQSCEALIRWFTDRGIIGPKEFIPLAEESGLIVPLSNWVLREAFRCNKLFELQGINNIISVNISAQVLLHKDFINMVINAAEEHDADIRKLDIEITEATIVEDVLKVNDVLDKLHDLGITISIDDFGTGYSSLGYLKKFSIDRIKIDRSFITCLNGKEDDQSIVNAIVAMGKSLRLIVTAEGVEDLQQFDYLKNIDCEEIQGYYISKPVPCEEYIDFYKNQLIKS